MPNINRGYSMDYEITSEFLYSWLFTCSVKYQLNMHFYSKYTSFQVQSVG